MFVFDSFFHDELCPQKADVLKLHLSKPIYLRAKFIDALKKKYTYINTKGHNEMFKCYTESHVLISSKKVPSEKKL